MAVDGFFVVDKPSGMTSHSVVSRCRRIVGQKRIGHSGTLDPGATGVLVVAAGRATRLIRFLSDLPKSYSGELVLGVATSTLDDEGEVTATFTMDGVTCDEVRAACENFVGAIMQVPPMVSAVQIGGRRLYELAREGIEIERAPRPVTVYRIDIEPTDEPLIYSISVDCSSGTYIRALAADIGAALGGGAHLRRLRRTAIGPFTAGRAASIDQLEKGWAGYLGSPAAMVGHLCSVKVDDDAKGAIGQGKKVDPTCLGMDGPGPWAVLDGDSALVAVFERSDGPGSAATAAVVLARP